MARLREGIGAKCDYRPLIYSHVPIDPGENTVLVADPWAYVRSYIHQEREGKNASAALTRLNRALYYARQAEGFYKAAETAELRTRGVMAYYGMLNLVKAFLSHEGVELETVKEHHGLTIPLQDPTHVEVAKKASGNNVNIFHGFSEKLGTPVAGTHSLTFLDVVHRIPELHGILIGTGLLEGRPSFLPVEVELLLTPDRSKFFEQVSYSKKHELRLKTENRFLSGARGDYFREGVEVEGRIVHQSKVTRAYSKTSCASIYRNSRSRFAKFSVCSMLTRQGYRYYVDLEAGSYHQLSYTLLLLFYIGSIERYRPTVVDQHFFGKQRPILSEALALCPDQFLYQVVSLITGDLCVRPYAAL